ncbi:MAG: four-carbon acid sugar kinase family protein [Opitutales bacterium]
MPKILVIADDLSGAAELGAAAYHRGLSSVICRAEALDSAADVAVVNTNSRALPREAAVARMAEVGAVVKDAGSDFVFMKIDSVLRGHAGAESRALRKALGLRTVLLGAGNPSRERVIRGGVVFVEGVPLHESPFREDPHFPARTAALGEIWESTGGVPDKHAELLGETSEPIFSEAALALTPDTLPVGSLDFFKACLAAWTSRSPAKAMPALGHKRRVLLVCGSKAGWPEREERFRSHGWTVRIPTFEGQYPAPGRSHELLGYGPLPPDAPAIDIQKLAAEARATITMAPPDVLALEGGETAAAVLEALGWQQLVLRGELAPGTALLQPEGSDLEVAIKPGSYPWPPPLLECLLNPPS